MRTPGSLQAKKEKPKEASWLSLVKVLAGLYKICKVDGESMSPTLSKGDIVIYRALEKEDLDKLKGKIIVFIHPLKGKFLMVKRVKEATTLGIEVRGDNENSSIDSRQFGNINKSNLIGLVEYFVDLSSSENRSNKIKMFGLNRISDLTIFFNS